MSKLSTGSFSIEDLELVQITINNIAGAAKEAAEEKAKELVKAGPTLSPGLLEIVQESLQGYLHSLSSLILLYLEKVSNKYLKPSQGHVNKYTNILSNFVESRISSFWDS
ncbi:hypothetical protein FTO70_17140 [Methanosarcina sp. KYL-1]|uniref:hypothetical protein n=1 Tax=Methanosarcina sp. KYL-1 TaxID=2602068 RepID=UPI002100A694|nr:hypothetical protein [Methanosarcina sp. KYL-1]MCQ1537363.1 hypothetical protein [Methanosarcina sp. KYL-1]